MARLSSGKRINSASDDAAGVAISSRLTSNIRGTDQAIRNALDGQALIDTAEGAHKEIENILQRMREIAVQAANDTNNAQDRANLQAKMDAMSAEIDRIAGTTTSAGTKMLDTENSDCNFHIGAGVSEQDQVKVSIGSMTSSALGLGGGTASGSSSSSSSSSRSGSGEASVTFTSGVNDTFDVSNGAEEINISVGLQAHLDSLSTTAVGFDDPSTNRTRAASFDLSSITETITSAVLTIRAKPLDDERSEGNDTIVLSGFDTNGTASMPQYNIGLGVDAGPNNYFDFDWQIDGRPAVPNEGFEITIDLSNFAAQQGTSLNLLDDINTEKLLDIIIADDTLVDFVELTVYFPSTSSSTSSGSITTPQKLGSEFQVNTHTIGDQSLPDITALSDGGFVATWVSAGQDGDDNGIYGQRYNAAGTAVGTEFRINSTTSNS
ncbi:hypothetical protein N9381_02205 [Paracoccaceae bacterium]|nr:hypothetical protein [Paracoccaceae bacterium]